MDEMAAHTFFFIFQVVRVTQMASGVYSYKYNN